MNVMVILRNLIQLFRSFGDKRPVFRYGKVMKNKISCLFEKFKRDVKVVSSWAFGFCVD
jgi:hypothetical protein